MKARQIYFYTTGEAYDIFSNVTDVGFQINIEGINYTPRSSEAVYQGIKALTAKNPQRNIASELFKNNETPGKHLHDKGRTILDPTITANIPYSKKYIDHPFIVKPLQLKEQLMYEILLVKFTQNLPLLNALLKTGNADIIENTFLQKSYNDDFWGNGHSGTGRNALGIALMRVREDLRNELEAKSRSIRVRSGFSKELTESLNIKPSTDIQQNPITKQNLSSFEACTTVAKYHALFQIQEQTAQKKTQTSKTAEERVLEALQAEGYYPELSIVDDIKKPGKKVVKLKFEDNEQASRFFNSKIVNRHALLVGNNSNIVILGPNTWVFKNLGVPDHGKTQKHKMFDALVYEHNQKQPKIKPQININPFTTKTQQTGHSKANIIPTMSAQTYSYIENYFNEVKSNPNKMGYRLSQVLANHDLKKINTEQFIDALLKTTMPIVFAENLNHVKGDGSDWTLEEISLLGRIGRVVKDVTVYSKNTYHPKQDDLFPQGENPKATLLFANGALISGCGADKDRVLENNKFSRDKFYHFLEENLLPLLQFANRDAGDQGAIITMPVLGGGQFCVDSFQGIDYSQEINEYYPHAMDRLIRNYRSQLPNIKGVVITGSSYETVSEHDNGLLLITTANTCGLYPQDFYSRQYRKTFPTAIYSGPYKTYTTVAGDHVSFPGNDGYGGYSSTHEGGTSTVTDVYSLITKIEGVLNDNIFFSPKQGGTWLDVCKKNQTTLNFDGIEVYNPDGSLSIRSFDSIKVFKTGGPLLIPNKKNDNYKPKYLTPPEGDYASHRRSSSEKKETDKKVIIPEQPFIQKPSIQPQNKSQFLKKEPRLSFEEWLKKQGVVDKRENTNKNALHQEAGINYAFASQESAQAFFDKHKFTVDQSRFDYLQFNDQRTFVDPASRKWSIYVTEKMHDQLLKQYHDYIKESALPRSPKEINKQLKRINTQLDLLETKEINPQLNQLDQQKLHDKNKQAQTFRTRLNKLQELSRNITEGWGAHESASAFDLSLRNFIALNMDILSEKELSDIKTAANLIMRKGGNVTTGVKQDANWFDFLHRYKENQRLQFITIDAIHQLKGEKNRLAVHNTTSTEAFNRITTISQDTKDQRSIPQFFPDKNGNSDTDSIYLDTGGMSTHRTVTQIWKKAVVIDGKTHHYEYYQTEYNAGAGAKWAEFPKFNPETGKNTTGVLWVVSTKRIKPNWKFTNPLRVNQQNDLSGFKLLEPDPITNLDEYNRVMEDTIEDLIIAQRMIRFYKPASQSTVPSDQHKLAKEDEAKKWNYWKNKIDSHLGSQIDELSFTGVPQTSGNCTIMSVNLMVGSVNRNLSEEHYQHAKQYNADGIIKALKAKQIELNKELQISQDYEMKRSIFKLIYEDVSAEQVEAVSFTLSTNPDLINSTQNEEGRTLLSCALYRFNDTCDKLKTEKDPNNIKELKRQEQHLYEMINLIINQYQGDIPDLEDDTALHIAAFYASDSDYDKRFIDIVVTLISKGANLDARNKYNETPLSTLASSPPDRAATLLFLVFEKLKEESSKEKTLQKNVITNAYIKLAFTLIEKNPKVLNIINKDNMTPLDWLYHHATKDNATLLNLLEFARKNRPPEIIPPSTSSTTNIISTLNKKEPSVENILPGKDTPKVEIKVEKEKISADDIVTDLIQTVSDLNKTVDRLNQSIVHINGVLDKLSLLRAGSLPKKEKEEKLSSEVKSKSSNLK